MRFNITLKLFLGFLAVILLNFFYVFVVNQLTDLNSIASILKRQDEAKNKLLQISSLQSDRRRSRTSFEAIGKPESIQNFQKTGASISTLVDSVTLELGDLASMKETVFRSESDRGPYSENSRKLVLELSSMSKYNGLFETSFKDFTDALIDSIKHTPAKAPSEKAKALSNILDMSDQKVSQSLKEITTTIDDQTKIVIKEIGHRRAPSAKGNSISTPRATQTMKSATSRGRFSTCRWTSRPPRKNSSNPEGWPPSARLLHLSIMKSTTRS